ncbi:unnamed protein product [Schistosoma margrebowiei]|uniref:Uncharacterized protein n=1 Tax=Schistosoma margrebowiei TaxID=48269 RepID=A0AA84ZSP5_9TREM|nr:unnamed protein product [Schistosoma margrebowiei]
MSSPCIKNSQNRESDLDRRIREKEENKRYVLSKNEESIKEREKLGFPPKYPTLMTLEDSTNISNLASASSLNRFEEIRGMDRQKPQNMSPGDISAFREGSNMAPPETLNKPLPMHDKFISDQVVRGRFAASLKSENYQSKQPLRTSIFPQLDVLNTRRLTADDKNAQNYLYTSSYQAAYGNRSSFYGNACRRLYPIKSFEAVADPIRGLMDSDSYYPATKSWIPELFNPVQYDQKQARYLHIKEDRPYEFCSYNSRINQIPGYSGSFCTGEKRIDLDNPYHKYKSLNLVRQDIPHEYVFDLNLNMPGYSGYQRKEMRNHDSTSTVSVC